jgi:hypothetical protein
MEPQEGARTAVSRRRFVQGAAAVAAGVIASPGSSASAADGCTPRPRPETVPPPSPIAGGLGLPDGSVINVWAPGDPSVTLPFTGTPLQGFDAEASTYADRVGFSAVAYHVGTATGADGTTFDLETDVRAFRGTYVADNGTRRFGTFAFI